jgi:hypothetical protein
MGMDSLETTFSNNLQYSLIHSLFQSRYRSGTNCQGRSAFDETFDLWKQGQPHGRCHYRGLG